MPTDAIPPMEPGDVFVLPTLLSDDDGHVLAEARRVLHEQSERAARRYYGTSETREAYTAGVVEFAMRRAEHAIFEALAVLSAHGHDPMASRWLHRVGAADPVEAAKGRA